MLLDSHSRPSYSPSPEVAHVLWMYLVDCKRKQRHKILRQLKCFDFQRLVEMFIYQWRWRKVWRPSLSVISAAFIAIGRSCLLANTSNTASRSSSYKKKKPGLELVRLSKWGMMKKRRFDMDLIEHSMQFISSLRNSVSVVAVHNKDQTLSVLEVVLPQGTDLKTNKRDLLIHNNQTRINRSGDHTLSWPPTSHTVKLMFLYSTVSTLKPVRR